MIGKTISHYKILEKLGDGGMGEVYLAEDTKLKRKVALKFLPKGFSRDPVAKKRFMEEARSFSKLDHTNICVIYDINETEDGQLFISMNYCQGDTLQNYIKEKDLTVKEILEYITQIAKGLEKAHSKGIVHCDIKPTNIIITEDGVVKIVDFGIAKIASEEKLISKDRTSGTIAYMSPEQVSNENINGRTDIWSLGIVFYEMLTKQQPFKDSYNEALMYSIINEVPESITSINPEILPELEKIVLKMLRKNPEDRYQSIKELLNDLNNYQKIVETPINPLKYFKMFFADKKNKRISLVSSLILSISIITIVYITVIRTPYVPSIGILNMENLGAPEDEFWSRGITEDLIINVASAGVIRVPTINDVNKYKLSEFSMTEIAEKLLVDYLLISSFFKADSVFDLWCRILDPKSGKDVFARKWSKPVKDASSITTILAGTILNNLGISSKKSTKVPVIINPDAYELYLKGKHVWETRKNNEDIFIARGLLQQALHKDQNLMQAKIQLGQTYTGTAKYDQALAIFYECLDYAKEIDNKNTALLAMLNIGNIHLLRYEIDEAIENYEKALKIARKNNDKYYEGKLLGNIGSSHYRLGNYDQAEDYYLQLYRISVILDDEKGKGEALNNLGSVYIEIEDYTKAMNSYKNSYNIFNKIDRKRQIGYSLIGISYGYMAIGKIDLALKYSEEALLSAREIIDRQNEINALTYIGEIYFYIGNNEDALDIFLQSYSLANSIGDILNFGISNQYLGLLMLRSGNYENSFKYFEKADSVWIQLDNEADRVWTQAAWALAALRTGDGQTAAVKSSQTEILLKEIVPHKDYATSVYYNLYNYYITIGDSSLAKNYLSNAHDELLNRLKYIDDSKNKDDLLNRVVEYQEIIDSYKKHFD